MSDETDSVVLEILKRLQSDISTMREDMHLMRMEMTAIRHDMASFRTMQDVHGAEIGNIKTRLDRVEARLDLRDQ